MRATKVSRTSFWLAAVCSSLGGLSSASAADLDPARQLFLDGVQQMQAGGCKATPVTNVALCESAVERFNAALELNPGSLGALKNLARVEQNLGRWCAAAASLEKLAKLAVLDPDPAKRLWGDFANTEYQRLKLRIPKLVLQLAPNSGDAQPYTVRVNGQRIRSAAIGKPLQFDPGDYEISLARSAHPALIQRVQLRAGETLRVVLALEKIQTLATSHGSAASRGERQFWEAPMLPLSVAAVGGAGLTLGLGFGYFALQERNAGCDRISRICDAQALRQARSRAQMSTAFTLGGGALLASGVTWHFWQSSRDRLRQDGLALRMQPVNGGAKVSVAGNLW